MRRFFSVATLLSSAGTLLCCALPALLVTLGLGSTLAAVISAVPQLVWLSEHKAPTFFSAAALLSTSAVLQLRARKRGCPPDPALAAACRETRNWSGMAFWVSLALFAVGAAFAWVPSWLGWA